jgi:glycosyltransferase involved in cell wall biosynthesis
VELVYQDRGWGGLDKFLTARSGDFEIVWICRTHNAERFKGAIARLLSNPKRPRLILDTEAIASRREYALGRTVGNNWWSEQRLLDEARQELLAGGQYDMILAVNAAEQDLIRRVLPGKEVVVLGHRLTPVEPDVQADQAWQKRKGYLFVGAVHDARSPNFDSLVWFSQKIWPLVRRHIPDATLEVVGHWESSLIKKGVELLDVEGVRFVGSVEDLDPYYASARVFVAPTRYAAGIPFKVHEAVSMGVPTVVTPLIAEQLGWAQGEGILYPESAQAMEKDFAECCVRLHEDPQTWATTRSAGLLAIRRDCSNATFRARLLLAVADTAVADESDSVYPSKV